MAKKITSAEFFDKNNAAFMKFGRMFTRKLTDQELINALAEKDLEKLAKVFKLVFEMLEENSPDSNAQLAAMISAYSEMGEPGEAPAKRRTANDRRIFTKAEIRTGACEVRRTAAYQPP